MLSLDHVVIPVRDPEASLAFYGETLGLPLVQTVTGDDWGGKAWLMLIFGLEAGRELVLTAFRGARPAGSGDLPADARHYAFAVDSGEAQDVWRRRLQAANVAFWEEDHGDRRSIYFPDPDGTILEITTPASAAGSQADPAARARAVAWIAESRALA